jgi:hypothetical protein
VSVEACIDEILHGLHLRKQVLERAIADLEELQRTGSGSYIPLETVDRNAGGFIASRRGRKSMPQEERKEVSERMKRYWATRRQAQQVSQRKLFTASGF